jgi:hypothetical protein
MAIMELRRHEGLRRFSRRSKAMVFIAGEA